MLKNSVMKEITFQNHKLTFKFIHKKHTFSKHIHDDKYMIGICLEGKNYFNMDSQDFEVTKGMLCLIPPNTVHSCKTINIFSMISSFIYLFSLTCKLSFNLSNKTFIIDITSLKEYISISTLLTMNFNSDFL